MCCAIVLARSARSARRTAHFDLEFPREPQLEPYWCFKHRRECKPVESARRFLLRYTLDTLERIEAFSAARADGYVARVLHGDARAIDLEGPYDGVITSPPYPGLIDYHEQHRYAYELLGVDERRDLELGRPARGTGRAAIEEYVDGVAAGARERPLVPDPRGRMCIVVNDRRDLYPEILRRAGLQPRRPSRAARQPPHGATGRRVLRVDSRRCGDLSRASLMSTPAASGAQRLKTGAGPGCRFAVLAYSRARRLPARVWFLRRPQQVWHPYVWAEESIVVRHFLDGGWLRRHAARPGVRDPADHPAAAPGRLGLVRPSPRADVVWLATGVFALTVVILVVPESRWGGRGTKALMAFAMVLCPVEPGDHSASCSTRSGGPRCGP